MAELVDTIILITTNKIFLAVFLSWLVSNLIKIMIILATEKGFSFSSLYRSGGMPSTHTSSVVGLAFGILLFDGVNAVFILSLAFAIVVVHDAMGVRFQTEKHARFLNELIKKQKSDVPLFLEHIGHKPKEVAVGIIIGILVPLILFNI